MLSAYLLPFLLLLGSATCWPRHRQIKEQEDTIQHHVRHHRIPMLQDSYVIQRVRDAGIGRGIPRIIRVQTEQDMEDGGYRRPQLIYVEEEEENAEPFRNPEAFRNAELSRMAEQAKNIYPNAERFRNGEPLAKAESSRNSESFNNEEIPNSARNNKLFKLVKPVPAFNKLRVRPAKSYLEQAYYIVNGKNPQKALGNVELSDLMKEQNGNEDSDVFDDVDRDRVQQVAFQEETPGNEGRPVDYVEE